MYPAGKELLLGQGPYPYRGGSVYVILSIMILTCAAVCSIVFIVRRLSPPSPQTPMQKTPGHLSSRFAGFIVGFLIVAITAILVAFLTYSLEWPQIFEVSDDGTVTSVGRRRSERGYRFGRFVHYVSMLGYLASGVATGVRMRKPFFRNGMSWGLLIAAVLALFAG